MKKHKKSKRKNKKRYEIRPGAYLFNVTNEYGIFEIFDRQDSHIHKQEGLSNKLLEEAIRKIEVNGEDFINEEVKFDSVIGYSNCVELNECDKSSVIYVRRKGRRGKTPMIKGKLPEPCDTVTVILKRYKSSNWYIVVTAFIGKNSKKEPWDKSIRSRKKRKESEIFWQNHALIYNPELVDEIF